MIDGFDTTGLITAHLLYLVPAAVAVARAIRFPTPDRLDRWLAGHGLETAGPGRELAARYLRRTRWIRTGGFVLGFTVIPLAWLWYTRDARNGDLMVNTVLVVSFGAAVLLAELVRPRPDGTMAATTPRLRRTYVPAFTRWDPLVVAAGFALLIGLSLVYDAQPGRQIGRATVAAGAWLAMIVVQRWILARPQRAASLELLRVDDAIRSTGATALSALGYGASALTLGGGLWDLVQVGTLSGPGRTVVTLAGAAVAAMGFALSFGFLKLENTWQVPRLRDTP